MTTFYDHDGIRITERWLSIGGRRCRVGHLRNLRVARGRCDRTARRAAYTAVVSLLVVGVTARHVPVAVSVALVVLPALVTLARARLVRPAYLLLADYGGATVALYATRDETEFGKVSRALARAAAGSRCRARSAMPTVPPPRVPESRAPRAGRAG
ncbi:DUF6232 family protein [Amorphoplanes digitatis]|uniref:Uncharacterized protein n=1 Tax=Actinoplanes digitatis TaxID=1868 RepID=A0A7W7I113_9ACTN|nr:DUF6232 family protein [Actinoplanes digitatis]MBB4764410.1 hypothetical protein [Actinoplanes digitatis]